jgi:hypothetical protein
MRKGYWDRICPAETNRQGWLDLEQIATVEVTSEDPSFPIEYAFWSNDGSDGALLKGNNKSALSSINLCRCIG